MVKSKLTRPKLSNRKRAALDTQLTAAYRKYEPRLSSRASFKIDNPSLCDDIVQTTFLKTWAYLVRGGKIDLMEAFLYHVLNGLIIDEYRKHRETSLDVLLEKGFEPNVDATERLFNAFDGKIAVDLIQYLPTKYQKVMRMRYMQDLSLEEMSRITGQSKNTMAVQAHRGLEKLKQLYDRTPHLIPA